MRTNRVTRIRAAFFVAVPAMLAGFSAASGAVPAPKQKAVPAPTIQSHTIHKEVNANASLNAAKGLTLTGTVELIQVAKGARVLTTLAGADGAGQYVVSVIETRQCPGGEAATAPAGSGEELLRVADIHTSALGKGTSEKVTREIKSPEDWTRLISKAVVVRKPKSAEILSCGILQSGGVDTHPAD